MSDEENLFMSEEANSDEKTIVETTPESEKIEEVVTPNTKKVFTQPKFDPKKFDELEKFEGKRKILPEEDYNKKVFTIKTFAPTPINLVDNEGNSIPPKKIGKSEGYESRLSIVFEEDDLKETYPKLIYWVNRGELSQKPSFRKSVEINEIETKELDHFTPTIDVIFAKFARHLGKKCVKDLEEADFYLLAVGQKVTLKLTKWTYEGKEHFRNDIADFVQSQP